MLPKSLDCIAARVRVRLPRICEKAGENGRIVPSIGYVCGGCVAVAQQQRRDLHEELRAEPLGEMPPNFDTATFDRYALKFSIHFLDALSPENRDRVIGSNPMFVIPEAFSLLIKEQILQHVPDHYMTTVQFEGHDRLFSSGEFRFFKPVPAKVILRALRKSKLIEAE